MGGLPVFCACKVKFGTSAVRAMAGKVPRYRCHFNKPLQVVTAPVEPKVGALQVHDWAPDGRSFLLA
jgi:hypothetical protein